jgi:homoserine kinase type II
VARLHKTRDRKSYFRRFEGQDSTEEIFYAVFDFLPGEDRYTWVDPNCTESELANSAVVLAQFHTAASSLKPSGKRVEPKILELLPVIADTLAACPGNSKHTAFDDYLMDNLELVRKNIADTRSILNEPEARQMAEIVIHCDFHPGNLKFQGEQVTGLFDFDWSKIDMRCFDVALALWYFCTSWDGPTDGQLQLDQVKVFLDAYQTCLLDHPGVGPLTPVEMRYLPAMINASNLYIFNWTIVDFYQKEVDPQEYLVFLRHHVNFTAWFETAANRERLVNTISSLNGNGSAGGVAAA